MPARPAWLIPVIALVGCATITTGTSESIAVITDPPGARCTFTRLSNTIGTIGSTPGSVTLTKSSAAVTITCEKPGYEHASAYLLSHRQGMIYGNMLIGGAVGMLIDAQSGAANSYPPSLTITLIPTRFESTELRNRFFDKMEEEIRQGATRDLATLRDPAAISAREQQRDAEIDQVEQRRTRATISSTSPSNSAKP